MLEMKNITLKLPGFSLQNIELKIGNGEYFVLLGSSGSGKTVFLETIAGMYRPNGEINYNNKNLLDEEIEKREVGFVYQDYELFPFLNVWDNIAFGLKNKKLRKSIIKEKVEEYSKIFKVNHLLKRYPENLSGGERQRVALARALVISPKILLLDEPLSALDKMNKDILIKELKNINNMFQITVIHVTHDMEEAIYLADNIGIMKNGILKSVMNKDLFTKKLKVKDYIDIFEMEV